MAIFGPSASGSARLVREQVATVVGLLIYLFIAEPIVTRIPALHSWTIYLPGAAANALTQVAQANQDVPPTLAGRPGPRRLWPHPRRRRHPRHYPPRHHLIQRHHRS